MVAEGYKETEIGVIPIDWEVTPLNDVIDRVLDFRGKTPKKIGFEWGGGTIQALSANNVKMGYIDFTRECNYASDELYEKWMNKGDTVKNDIILTMEAPLGKIALIPDNKKYILSQRVILLKTKNKVNNLYLYQYLSSKTFQNMLYKNSTGTTAKGIKQTRLLTLNIILPPLKEQEKIADILSSADEKIAAIASQIQKVETLKKGLLQKLLSEGIGHSEFKDSELGKIPDSWEVVKIGENTKLMGGYAFKSKDAKEYGTRWLKIANVGINTIKWEQISYLQDNYKEEYKKFLLEKNDVILAMTRPILSMKLKIAKITNNDIPALLNQRVGKFIFDDKVNSEFMYQLFQHIDFVKLLMLKIMGTDPPNVSSEQLESIIILLPPLKEQKQIAEILSTVDEKLEVIRAKKEKYETLKKGLLQKLLSGEIRV